MTTRRGVAAIFVCVGIAAFASGLWSASAQSRQDKAIAENRDLDRQIIQAVEERNAEKLMTLYWKSPELLAIGPGGDVARGWEAVKAIEEKFYAGIELGKIEVLKEAKYPQGDAVWSVLTVKFAYKPKGEPFIEGAMQITDLRRRIGGKWMIVFNHGHDLTTPERREP